MFPLSWSADGLWVYLLSLLWMSGSVVDNRTGEVEIVTRPQRRTTGKYPINAITEPPYYAYAWFRRIRTRAPGNWELCGAIQMPRVIRHLDMHKHIDIPGPGEIIYGNTMCTHHDYIYLQMELPPEMYKQLEEV